MHTVDDAQGTEQVASGKSAPDTTWGRSVSPPTAGMDSRVSNPWTMFATIKILLAMFATIKGRSVGGLRLSIAVQGFETWFHKIFSST